MIMYTFELSKPSLINSSSHANMMVIHWVFLAMSMAMLQWPCCTDPKSLAQEKDCGDIGFECYQKEYPNMKWHMIYRHGWRSQEFTKYPHSSLHIPSMHLLACMEERLHLTTSFLITSRIIQAQVAGATGEFLSGSAPCSGFLAEEDWFWVNYVFWSMFGVAPFWSNFHLQYISLLLVWNDPR